MKKIGIFASALLMGALFLGTESVVNASSSEEESKAKVTNGEYSYDSEEFRVFVEYVDKVEGAELGNLSKGENSIGILSHAPSAGGGTWRHGFLNNPIPDLHYSWYQHNALDHRSSVSNSNSTVRGPFRIAGNSTGSYSEIAVTLTGNRANWQTFNSPIINP